MIQEFTQYVEAVPQIRAALEDLDVNIDYTVSARWPREQPKGNLITVTEITNQQTEIPVVDQIAYQIDLWSQDVDVIRSLTPLVNAAICGIGLRRDYAGPEEYLDTQQRYVRKTFRFGRKVDKRTNRLID